MEIAEAPAFGRYTPKELHTALEEAIVRQRERWKALSTDVHPPDFDNTVAALEQSSAELDELSSLLFNLHSANTDDELERVVEVISPQLAALSNDLLLDPAMFERVRTVAEGPHSTDPVRQRLLDKTYKTFVRNGARLEDAKRPELRSIDQRLALATVQFGQNVLKSTRAFKLELSEEQLDGLPEAQREAARTRAQETGSQADAVLTLDQPSYLPAMMYLNDRGLREQLYRAYTGRATSGDTDNRPLVLEIAGLRRHRARVLGFEHHADFVLRERMVENETALRGFLSELLAKARPAAERDAQDLKTRALQDGVNDLKPWDTAYYGEKLKRERYDLDSEQLRPYFALPKVLDGLFQLVYRLYGLHFDPQTEVPKYHEDVVAYAVRDADDRFVGLLYLDFFPRAGKRAGAWMTSYRDARGTGADEQRPWISIVCNFTPPGAQRPSLLSFDEVTTLFHEMGHALHGLLAKGPFASLNGTHVYWDFVELPSQFMENWCYEPEVLSQFAHHWQTGAPLPLEWVERIRNSANHLIGIQTLRQLGFGLLDLAWHGATEGEYASVETVERAALQPTQWLEPVEGSLVSTSFSHIFQGGYAAGYYSYKWAEVLDADAFEAFRENGLFDPQTAAKFRRLLETGGQAHPAKVYRDFRGRDADPEALLRRSGLIPTQA
ncbi:M3 family peptidase [bacterium]|nr:M3 family peptidase [bacterium]